MIYQLYAKPAANLPPLLVEGESPETVEKGHQTYIAITSKVDKTLTYIPPLYVTHKERPHLAVAISVLRTGGKAAIQELFKDLGEKDKETLLSATNLVGATPEEVIALRKEVPITLEA